MTIQKNTKNVLLPKEEAQNVFTKIKKWIRRK